VSPTVTAEPVLIGDQASGTVECPDTRDPAGAAVIAVAGVDKAVIAREPERVDPTVWANESYGGNVRGGHSREFAVALDCYHPSARSKESRRCKAASTATAALERGDADVQFVVHGLLENVDRPVPPLSVGVGGDPAAVKGARVAETLRVRGWEVICGRCASRKRRRDSRRTRSGSTYPGCKKESDGYDRRAHDQSLRDERTHAWASVPE
jgi:hypothetical protein